VVAIDPSVVLDAVKFVVDESKAAFKYAVGDQGVVKIPKETFSVKNDAVTKKIADETKVGKDEHPFDLLTADVTTTQFAYLKRAAASVSLSRRLSGNVPEYGAKAADLAKDKTYKQYLFCVPIAVKWQITTLNWKDPGEHGDNLSWVSLWDISAGSGASPHNDHRQAATFKIEALENNVKPDGTLLKATWSFYCAGRGAVYKTVESAGELEFATGYVVTSGGADAKNISIF
jgi:hypothetical protein